MTLPVTKLRKFLSKLKNLLRRLRSKNEHVYIAFTAADIQLLAELEKQQEARKRPDLPESKLSNAMYAETSGAKRE